MKRTWIPALLLIILSTFKLGAQAPTGFFCPDTSVSANTITCSIYTTLPAYFNGMSLDVLLKNSATGATTINVNGLGAKAVTVNGATAITTGILVVGGTYRLTYDGTEFVVQGPVTVLSSAAIIALWTGCSSPATQVLGANGACATISSSFSTLTSGTNSTAAMVVGTGASFTVSGSTLTLTSSPLIINGPISAPAWTTNGIRIQGSPSTMTDTTSTGTVAAAYTDVLGGNTIAATNATVYTNYAALYIKNPITGTNVTFTNRYALGADSLGILGNGGLNAPAIAGNGTWITGGSGTSTKPYVLIEPAGTTSTGWSTAGTGLGINCPGATGNALDLQSAGVDKINFTCSGGITATQSFTSTGGGVSVAFQVSGSKFATATNCNSAASPAVCGSAAAGSVTIAATATTVQVNTSAVTANSQILLMYDASLGTRLGVTCNTTEPALYGVTARTAGTSFTITATASTVNPACFSYIVEN